MIVIASALSVVAVFLNTRGGIDRPADWFTNTHGVTRERIRIHSPSVGRTLPAEVLLPKGFDKRDRRPLLVLLHGRGTPPEHLSNGALTKALAEAGPDAPIVALPYGGDASYWHDRADGKWGRYVTAEIIPYVERKFGSDRRRVALGGVSMGGFGAFNLARLHPGRFCAIGGHAPALWQTAGETAAGAFDDAEDFARNDVVAAARNDPTPYLGVPIWLDAGDQDPFRPGDQAMISALRRAGANLRAETWPGRHENAYWEAHFGAYLRFYTRALARCNR
ncbi:MAG: alpha/beta hydrolase-fold protein [Solirubrobacterales bacterium]